MKRRTIATLLALCAATLAAVPSRALECLDRYAAEVDAVRAAPDAAAIDWTAVTGSLLPIAADGYAPAMHLVAVGFEAQQDEAAAAHWMLLAAARGYPPAYGWLGDRALAAAEAAEAQAQPTRASLLERRALFWYRLGETYGEPDSLWGLAALHRRGKVVEASPEAAFSYTRSAVEQGATSRRDLPLVAERSLRLAQHYAAGIDTKRDPVQAWRWVTLPMLVKIGTKDLDQNDPVILLHERLRAELGDSTVPPVAIRKPPGFAERAPHALHPVPVDQALVLRIQAALAAAGLEPGPVTGVFSDATARAIVEHELREGVPVTGAITNHLIEVLRIEPLLTDAGSCASKWLDVQPPDTLFSEDGGDHTASPKEALDQALLNAEANLRNQMVNDAVLEWQDRPIDGTVRAGAPIVCGDIAGLATGVQAAVLGQPVPAGVGCFAPTPDAPARLLWCSDPDAAVCELEIETADGTRRVWGGIGVLQ